jgi:hypothetical protein
VVGLRSASHPLGGFAGEAVLRNGTPHDLRVDVCAPDVEREVRSGEWVTVLRRYCPLEFLSDVEVPPGSAISHPWSARAPFSTTGSVTLDADLAGRYRLVYRYRIDGYLDDPEEARSAPFDVRD